MRCNGGVPCSTDEGFIVFERPLSRYIIMNYLHVFIVVIFVDFADPEIHQVYLLRIPFQPEQDVFGFEIAMNHSFVVNLLDDGQYYLC